MRHELPWGHCPKKRRTASRLAWTSRVHDTSTEADVGVRAWREACQTMQSSCAMGRPADRDRDISTSPHLHSDRTTRRAVPGQVRIPLSFAHLPLERASSLCIDGRLRPKLHGCPRQGPATGAGVDGSPRARLPRSGRRRGLEGTSVDAPACAQHTARCRGQRPPPRASPARRVSGWAACPRTRRDVDGTASRGPRTCAAAGSV